jgi:hypothetical protein
MNFQLVSQVMPPKKTFRICLAVLALLVAGFIFGFKMANAQLPVEAGLGEACTRSVNCVDIDDNGTINEIDCGAPENKNCSLCKENIQCASPFYCGRSGKCVQCEDATECTDALGESCTNGVCTLPGGNNAGDLCLNDNNCKSGFKCGSRKVCEEVKGFKKFNFSCKDDRDCANSLFCNSNGRCVECGDNQDCAKLFGDSNSLCDQGVCSLPKGKAIGGWCTKDVHCASGKCSDGNICVAAKGTSGDGDNNGENDWTGVDITIEDVADIIEGIACWLMRVAAAIMVIFLVLAGLRFMNARGDASRWESAKKNFQHVLIGILVIMAVYVIIATIAYAVGRTDFSLIPLVC